MTMLFRDPCGGSGLAPFDAARAKIAALAGPIADVENATLADCVGRILAAPVDAPLSLPLFDHSAMDGYAVRAANLAGEPPFQLAVDGRTAPGEAPAFLKVATARRIFTGAPIPEGADAVVMQEHVLRESGRIVLFARPQPGLNIRRAGEEIALGERLFASGVRLDWRHVAMAAAQGLATLPVRRRPRVALLSTGRELRGPGEPLGPGAIHDSNGPMLSALLEGPDVELVGLARVADEPASIRAALDRAADGCDFVVTAAGISVGDEDHVRAAVEAVGGAVEVLKVAMKPGKPVAAGRIGRAVFLGLPGNPYAALAGAVAFAFPLIARMQGRPDSPAPVARASFDWERQRGRTELVPVRLASSSDGLHAERLGPGGSARLKPLLLADALAIVPAETERVRHGDVLELMQLPRPSHGVPACRSGRPELTHSRAHDAHASQTVNAG